MRPGPAHGSTSDTNTHGHLVAAQEAIAATNWTLAQKELAIALRADPLNADTHNMLGYMARKGPTANLPKAFEHYSARCSLIPGTVARMSTSAKPI